MQEAQWFDNVDLDLSVLDPFRNTDPLPSFTDGLGNLTPIHGIGEWSDIEDKKLEDNKLEHNKLIRRTDLSDTANICGGTNNPIECNFSNKSNKEVRDMNYPLLSMDPQVINTVLLKIYDKSFH